MASYTAAQPDRRVDAGRAQAAVYPETRMPDLTCPVCGATGEPAAQIRTVAICGACGVSLHVADDGTVTRATATETSALTDDERLQLRRARGAIRKP